MFLFFRVSSVYVSLYFLLSLSLAQLFFMLSPWSPSLLLCSVSHTTRLYILNRIRIIMVISAHYFFFSLLFYSCFDTLFRLLLTYDLFWVCFLATVYDIYIYIYYFHCVLLYYDYFSLHIRTLWCLLYKADTKIYTRKQKRILNNLFLLIYVSVGNGFFSVLQAKVRMSCTWKNSNIYGDIFHDVCCCVKKNVFSVGVYIYALCMFLLFFRI